MPAKKFLVISGGSGSIGKEISRFLVKKNFKIINIDIKKLNYKNVINIQCDLKNINDINNKLKILFNPKFKKIYGLINCAGITIPGETLNYDYKNWRDTLNVNLTSAFLISQTVVKLMKKFKIKGSIINITSISASIAISDSAAYNVSKAGLKQLTKSLALDYSKYNIRVNCLSPGYTKSKMTIKSWKNKKLRKKRDNRIILNRWAKTSDYNEAVLFMLDNKKSGYMTGAEVLIDGGWMAKGL